MTEYAIRCSDCGWQCKPSDDLIAQWETHRALTGHTHHGQVWREKTHVLPRESDPDLLLSRVETLERIVAEYGDHFLKVAESIQNVMAGMQQFRDSPLPGSLGPRLDRIETQLRGIAGVVMKGDDERH